MYLSTDSSTDPIITIEWNYTHKQQTQIHSVFLKSVSEIISNKGNRLDSVVLGLKVPDT